MRAPGRAVALVWLGVAGFAVLVWLSAEASIAHLGAQAREAALMAAGLRAATLAADLERTLESTAGLATLAQARATLLERDDRAGAEAIERQLQVLARRPALGIADMAITDRAGRPDWSSAPGASAGLAAEPWFARLRDGKAALAIGAAGRPGPIAGIPVARPLVDGDGDFAGVAVAALDIAALSRQLSQPNPRRDGLALLLRPREGAAPLVLAHGNHPAEPARAAPPDLLRRLATLAAATPEGARLIEDGPSGRHFIAGWSQVEPSRLMVAVVAEAGVALGEHRREAEALRAVAAMLTLLAMMGAAGLLLLRARRHEREALAEARRAQSATEVARAELERLVASLPALVYHGDLGPDGTLTRRYLTANAARVIGWPHDLLPPRDPFLAHLDPGAGAEVAAFFAGLLRGGPDTLEYRMARPDGSMMWLRHHARLVGRHNGGGEVIGSLADITEERALRAQAAIASHLATLGEMAGSIAHELNRPLAVMVMAAHNALAALDETPPDLDQLRGRLTRIADQGVRANHIIHHLQRLSRSENEPQAPVCLRRAVEGALALSGGGLRQGHVVVENRLPADLPPVLGQQVAIEQVLVNLLANARDAMAARPADARRLRLSASHDAGQVVLEVADSGPGIPEPVLARLFEPFFTTKSAGHGTGLGLAICHAAMRGMGGSITAHNTPQGATFRLVFRRASTDTA